MNNRCSGIHCYFKDTDDDIREKEELSNMCPNFDIHPTIIPHQERVIAIGDIHGDMELAINFLKAAKVISEINNPSQFFNNYPITEYTYRMTNNFKLEKYKQVFDSYNKLFNLKNQHNYTNDNIVYRYYLINGISYVKVIQDDNNNNYDKSRWFKWIGNNTFVVQVGDQVDRCRPYPGHECRNIKTAFDEDSDLEIMLFYDSLGKIAKLDGGRVFSLLGNHELMNVEGDTRYVSTKGLREYSPEPKTVEQGEINRVNIFNKIISKKMACTRSTVLVIGDYLFVHGGIAEKLSEKYKLVDINSIIRKYLYTSLKDNSQIRDVIRAKTSPLWYRTLAYIPMDNNNKQHPYCDTIYNPIINNINNKNNFNDPTFQIKGMVIGHTPQFSVFNKGITTACHNRIIRTDIGASHAFDYFAQENDRKSREPQVAEILTNLKTKESTVNILFI